MHHLLKTLLETAYAMKHLHTMHILHRDLKIQNILLRSSNRDSRGFTVKVSDFGLARVWDGRGGTSPTENQRYAGALLLSSRFESFEITFNLVNWM
jgi:serine/threonine protein kinase